MSSGEPAGEALYPVAVSMGISSEFESSARSSAAVSQLESLGAVRTGANILIEIAELDKVAYALEVLRPYIQDKELLTKVVIAVQNARVEVTSGQPYVTTLDTIAQLLSRLIKFEAQHVLSRVLDGAVHDAWHHLTAFLSGLF